MDWSTWVAIAIAALFSGLALKGIAVMVDRELRTMNGEK